MASEKITAIIESVKGLTVLELKELIDAYCEEFGVSAVAAAAPAAAGAAAAAEEEKTEFDVILAEAGATKMHNYIDSDQEGSVLLPYEVSMHQELPIRLYFYLQQITADRPVFLP